MIEFDRKPQGIMDGIEVFLPLGPIGRLDEYQQRNPYRTDVTKQSFWDQARFRMILEETEGRDVLDLGSGEGELSSALACKHQVEGLDISISAVRMAKSLVPDAHFVVGDANDPPYGAKQFDTVVLANIFEHVESPCTLLRAAHRLLREEGRLVISTPSRYKTRNMRRALMGRPVILNSQNHVTEYTNGQVEELLRWCGFSLVTAKTNLRCNTMMGTALAYGMQIGARLIGSHIQFGDPTVYVARPIRS